MFQASPQKRSSAQKEQPHPDRNGGRPTPDSILSAKLSNMSIEERSDGLNDLHGIADIRNETPEVLNQKSHEMSRALLTAIASLSVEDSLAYREAVTMSPEYVDGLKIRFLRAEHGYDSQNAAHRMIKFFDHKKGLFGKDKLVQDITLQDLGAEATDALRRGLFQVLHQRDRAGRPIFYCQALVNMLFPMKACVSPRRRSENKIRLRCAPKQHCFCSALFFRS
jgi:hypothetical protein